MKRFSFDKKSGRKYFDQLDTWRCSKRQQRYDVEVLGTAICPRCKIKMSHPKEWNQLWVNSITGKARI